MSVCYNCNETGHFSRECPSGRGSGGGRSGGGQGCFNCGETGHMARECTRERSSGGGGGRGGGGGGSTCYGCGERGHFSRECPNGRGGLVVAEAETEADASTAERPATWPESALRRDLVAEAEAAVADAAAMVHRATIAVNRATSAVSAPRRETDRLDAVIR